MTTSTETKRPAYPLRAITGRPSQMIEVLECGHRIVRPAGLGEDLTKPSKVSRRRCWKCEPLQPTPRPRKITGRAALRVDDVTRPE